MSVREVSGWRDGSRKLKIHPSIHLLIPHQGRGGRWGLSSALRTHAGAGFHNLGRNKCVEDRLAGAGRGGFMACQCRATAWEQVFEDVK